MDPTRIFKDKDVDALAPPASGVRDGSIRRSSHLADGCTFWSLYRTACHNGDCREETQRFRQCPGRPREQLQVDPKSKEERWVGVEDDEQLQTRPREDLFDLSAVLPSFGALGGATDDFVAEVMPELERMRSQLERDPTIRAMTQLLDAMQLPIGQYLPPVPGPFRSASRGRLTDADALVAPRGLGREVPIQLRPRGPDSASTPPSPHVPAQDNGLRNSAMPNPRDLSDDTTLSGPLSNIGGSLNRWTHKLTSILKREPPQSETAHSGNGSRLSGRPVQCSRRQYQRSPPKVMSLSPTCLRHSCVTRSLRNPKHDDSDEK